MKLIERIEVEQGMFPSTATLEGVLADCKVELSKLAEENESLRNQNSALDTECARLEAELAKAKEYVPLSYEIVGYLTVTNSALHGIETPILADYIRMIEREVIKRANLVVKESK